jgi:hypothetical protein
MIYRAFLTTLALLTFSLNAKAQFSESWESPVVVSGGTSAVLPPGWELFFGIGLDKVEQPNTSTAFNSVAPLAGPARGNQFLSLAGLNTGVARLSGLTLQPDTTYTLAAAIGNSKLVANDSNWSLQIWADSNSSGLFEGSIAGGDTFIGQQFGTNTDALTAAAGEWAYNSFSFNSNSFPLLHGKQLIVFVNNYSTGTSYYDNVSISSAVPELPSLWLALVGLGCIAVRRG